MLNINDKIYYIDYEESGSVYTVKKIVEEKKNSILPPGLYYAIHADNLSDCTGYYSISVDSVDNDVDRFFSTPEKAHDAYVNFKKQRGL